MERASSVNHVDKGGSLPSAFLSEPDMKSLASNKLNTPHLRRLTSIFSPVR